LPEQSEGEHHMSVFEHALLVHAPVEAVADFHRDSRVLQKLTPPPVLVQLHHAGAVAEGSNADFTLWFGPLPVRWIAVHSNVAPLEGFTDRQVRGPFQHWEHVHSFIPEGDRATRVVDHIEYAHFPGVRGLFTRLAFSPVILRVLFAFRAWVTRRALEGHARPKESYA
jgi:ligand-binding SRPBCC domain-containing protein